MEQQNLRPDGGCQPQSHIPVSTNSLKVSPQDHSSSEEPQIVSNADVEKAVQKFSSENAPSTRLPLQAFVVKALVAKQVECLILDTAQVLEGKLTMPSKLSSYSTPVTGKHHKPASASEFSTEKVNWKRFYLKVLQSLESATLK
jgi:hypothetical protein